MEEGRPAGAKILEENSFYQQVALTELDTRTPFQKNSLHISSNFYPFSKAMYWKIVGDYFKKNV